MQPVQLAGDLAMRVRELRSQQGIAPGGGGGAEAGRAQGAQPIASRRQDTRLGQRQRAGYPRVVACTRTTQAARPEYARNRGAGQAGLALGSLPAAIAA